MSYLDDLKKLTWSQAGKNLGNWADYIGTNLRLPEFKISEALAAEPTMNTANPGVTVNDMNKKTAATLSEAAKLAAARKAGATVDTSDTGGGSGGGNGGGGNGGGGNGGGGNGEDEAAAARARFEANQRRIQSRLDSAKQYVQELIGGYGKTKEDTQGLVKNTYAKLQDLIKEKLGQSMETLDQSDVGVQNTYGRLAGNARRAMDSTMTKNNLLAKALGNASSSFYQNLQGKSRNQGVANIHDTYAEEAAKRAAIGTQKSATTTEFGQDAVSAENEETGLINAAQSKYDEDVANARMLERNYNIDSEAAIAEAESNLNQTYKDVDDYKSARAKNPLATTGQGYANTYDKTQNYSALGKISDTLGNNTALNKGNAYVGSAGSALSGITSALGQYNPNSSNYFLKTPTKPKVWDELTGTYK